ncbi:MAG: DUF4199 domain-containing protein [Opitutaceae bacterium]|nr:DUF4199 domain-containing protein [Opitutaceae bacterium]
MKTCVAYGFALTLAGALLSLSLFFLGFHSDADKVGTAQIISSVALFGITTIAIVLGIKARRAEVPGTEDFGYGRALGAGVTIGLFAALFNIVTNYFYLRIINPGFCDILVQAQIYKWEAAGMTAERIEQAEETMRKMLHPAIQGAFAFVGGLFFSTIISLIAAAWLKRPAAQEPLIGSG